MSAPVTPPEPPPPPELPSAKRLPLTWIFVAIGLALLAAGVALHGSAPAPDTREAIGEQPLDLRSFELTLRSVQREADVAGLLQARRSVEIVAEGEGKVIEVGAEELDRVEAGQLLVRMDPLLAELEVARAEASLARAVSTRQLARASLKRQKSLAKGSVASEQALEEAINAEAVAGANVKDADAALAQARDRLEKKVIFAPFAGELRAFPIEVGEVVRLGERVAELLEVDRLRVTIGLSDREVVAVRTGVRAQLLVEARPGEAFEGTVLRVGAAVDAASRKFPVQIEVANDEGRLLPGMVARVQLELGTPMPLLSIPREVMLAEFGMPFVYLLKQGDDGWRAVRRRVTVRDIPFKPVEVEVLSGLEAGDRIALSALRQLHTGMRVAPREPVRATDTDDGRVVGQRVPDRASAPRLPDGSGE